MHCVHGVARAQSGDGSESEVGLEAAGHEHKRTVSLSLSKQVKCHLACIDM